MNKPSRRTFIGGVGAAVAAGAAFLVAGRGSEASAEVFEINLTPEQWRRRLTPEQFRVLRQQGTERSGSSALMHTVSSSRATPLCGARILGGIGGGRVEPDVRTGLNIALIASSEKACSPQRIS